MISALLCAVMAGQLPTKFVDPKGVVSLAKKAPTFRGKESVLFFIATGCPVANRYAPEIERIYKSYSRHGFMFYRVYVTDKSHAKEVAQHGKEFGLSFPALLDPSRSLVKQTGVKVTPEAVVLNSNGQVIYRGRIDDQNIEHGVIRKEYRRDLRIALDEIINGKPISVPVTQAIGCFL